jgi:hypothetical protein
MHVYRQRRVGQARQRRGGGSGYAPYVHFIEVVVVRGGRRVEEVGSSLREGRDGGRGKQGRAGLGGGLRDSSSLGGGTLDEGLCVEVRTMSVSEVRRYEQTESRESLGEGPYSELGRKGTAELVDLGALEVDVEGGHRLDSAG